jgi:NhaA family Na+:H+ antiporter
MESPDPAGHPRGEPPGDPPATSPKVPPIFGAVVAPIQAFFRLEAASGVVLLACALAALAWANLGGIHSYRAVLETGLSVGVGGLVARFTLLELVNDGLMTVFFFVVGMEIKRELVDGELRTFSRAILPAIAALGGMIVPAAIYAALNHGGPGRPGWGIPMATDIAFTIGVLALLRSRVPRALVVFVTALAIFDDIGGILVIALFYGHGVDAAWLAGAGGVGLGLAAMSRAHVRGGLAWTAAGAALWYALHRAGIHATIAGVVLGLAIPARTRRPLGVVLDELARHAARCAQRRQDQALDAAEVLAIEERLEDVEAPLTRFVHALHPWVAFGIMPLFALVNSGVHVAGLERGQLLGRVALGTALGLLVGKQLGIFAFSLAAVKLGVGTLPTATTLPKLFGASVVAGIGFTVALFIATLAFPGAPALLDEAKVGILAGSLAAGLLGAAALMLTARVRPRDARQAAAEQGAGGVTATAGAAAGSERWVAETAPRE